MPSTCPSFIDLCAFAADPARAAIPAPGGFAIKPLPLRGGPVEVASWHFPAGSGASAGAAGDCFVIVAQGRLRLSVAGQALDLGEGDAIVLAAGAGFAWSAQGAAVAITMRYTQGTAGSGGAVRIDPGADLQPSGAPLAELLVGPTPSCRNHTSFLSADGEFMAGLWDSTPYHRLPMPYRHFELMYLLKGSVSFVDEVGKTGSFAAGDIFLVEQHAQCSWESREDVAKIYAIYRPKA